MYTYKVTLLTLTIMAVTACGQNKQAPQIQLSPAALTQSQLLDQSQDGAIKVSRQTFSDHELYQQRSLYKENDLKQIPVDPKYNAMVFKIYNVQSYNNTYFFAPKIYAYGGEDKSRMTPKVNDNGTITLDFPVILVDGTKSKIPAGDGVSFITLPESMTIKYQTQLRNELSQRLGSPQFPASLPGCPKKVYIRVANKEYDATPLQFKLGDYCQLNSPFTASVTLPEKDARYLLENALYNNAVDINVLYETKARLSVAQMTIEFDKNKTFKELEAQLNVNHFYADVEIRTHVKKVMKRMSMNMSMVGEIDQRLDLIVNRAMNIFFERFESNPSTTTSKCGQALVCFRLSHSSLTDSTSFKIQWQHSKNEMTGQHYISWAKLRPLNDSVQIGGQDRANLERGKSIETGLTVSQGDLFEITPSYLIVERRHVKNPVKTRRNNNVCIKSKRHCTFWEIERPERPGRNYKEVSRSNNKFKICIAWKDKCLQHQNRWIDTTTYGLTKSVYDTIHNPVGQFQEIYEGLSFKFTYSEHGTQKEMTCPLNVFHREGLGKSIIVRLENSVSCQIFKENRNQPMLHIVNNIHLYPVKYLSGKKVNNWNGSISQKPIEKTFFPDIQFSGKILIRGYKLGTSNSFTNER